MASMRKVTVTLPAEQVEGIRRLVASGGASSVSGFVQHAVSVALNDVGGWGALLTEALAVTGGELTEAERRWADGVLGHGSPTAGEAA
jgi:Arc/MetJ-type ribon-helix-helix transcriptional regulator